MDVLTASWKITEKGDGEEVSRAWRQERVGEQRKMEEGEDVRINEHEVMSQMACHRQEDGMSDSQAAQFPDPSYQSI